MAYTSNETGKNEVYVRPFPDVNKRKWPVSTGGGILPLWSPDGGELFYYSGDAVMAVPVETKPISSLESKEFFFEDPIIAPGLVLKLFIGTSIRMGSVS